MKVYVKISSVGPERKGAINYLHAFTGRSLKAKEEPGAIIVEKSLIRIGKPGAYFTEPGLVINLGKKPRQRDLGELQIEIIEAIFEDYFDVEQVAVHG